MTNIGIIAEFNPYHNGHAYLIREARRLVNAAADASDSGADEAGAGVVVLMSGNFVQRGSAAVFDKYTRARAALTDADIIFELPTLWAASDAGHFAGCGVELFNKMNCIDYLAFGIEAEPDTADSVISGLQKASDILADEPSEFKEMLKEGLSSGQSYPAARMKALLQLSDINQDTLSTSNNILALEYLTAIKKTGSRLKPIFIPRMGSDYNDAELTGEFSSATAIREAMNSGTRLDEYMPQEALSVIEKYLTHPVLTDEYLMPYIISALRTKSESELLTASGINSDLLDRLEKAPVPCSFAELSDYMKTRNVTMTRIRRLLLSLALGIEQTDLIQPGRISSPEYINLLAMRRDASRIIKLIQDIGSVTVINKKSSYRAEDALSDMSWKTDIRTTDIYNQMFYTCTGVCLPSELTSNIQII